MRAIAAIVCVLFSLTLLSPTCNESKNSSIVQNFNLPADSVFFMLKRTPCFGKCPVYEFRLYGDGSLIYEGRHFVEKMGKFHGEAGKSVMQAIATKAKEINYFYLAAKYPEDPMKEITDAASTVTFLNTGEKNHKVVNKKVEAPAELTAFENFADSLLNTIPIVNAE